MFSSNQWLTDFIGQNWMGMVILYSIVRSMFPNSKMLNAIGQTFSGMFPVFRKEKPKE